MSDSVEAADSIANMDNFLTFIDSLEISDTEAAASSDSSSSLQSIQAGHLSECSGQRHNVKRKKRKRTNLRSSTRLQQSKKAETLFLRKRVLELEEQITQLKIAKCGLRASFPRRSSNTAKPTNEIELNWVKMAKDEYNSRLKAEKTNRTLKILVAKQMEASVSFQASLFKQAASNEMDFQIHPQLFKSSQFRKVENSIIAKVEDEVPDSTKLKTV